MQTLYKADGTPINLLQDMDIESGSNYIKFNNGILICFGTAILEKNGSSSVNLKFPIVFINTSIFITISNLYLQSKDIIWSVGAIQKDNFFAYTNISLNSGNFSARYIAIGRWK